MLTRLKTLLKRRNISPQTEMESMSQEDGLRILVVCMGNICRSPMAEGVLRKHLETHAPNLRVTVDSAGTHGYHAGAPPDNRAQVAATRRGYEISHLAARRVVPEDFERFDLLLAMDRDNLEILHAMAPEGQASKARLFLEFSSTMPGGEVPDPYYGGATGFERVLDLVEDAVAGLLPELERLSARRSEPAG